MLLVIYWDEIVHIGLFVEPNNLLERETRKNI